MTTELCSHLMRYATARMARLPYHNKDHVGFVFRTSNQLGCAEGFNQRELDMTRDAAALHDIIYRVGAKDNEIRSAEVARNLLGKQGYEDERLAIIAQAIEATQLPQHPETVVAQALCDADLAGLGMQRFWRDTELVRQEFGVEDQLKWYSGVRKLLEGQTYFTVAARDAYQRGVDKNIKFVGTLIDRLEGEDKIEPVEFGRLLWHASA